MNFNEKELKLIKDIFSIAISDLEYDGKERKVNQAINLINKIIKENN